MVHGPKKLRTTVLSNTDRKYWRRLQLIFLVSELLRLLTNPSAAMGHTQEHIQSIRTMHKIMYATMPC